MKRFLALVMALCMLVSAALAEEFVLEAAIPLVDEAAAQAMEQDGDRYCGVRPMAVDVSDDGRAVRILGDVYLADAQLEQLTQEQYARVEWLDRRGVVELRLEDATWQVTSFSLDAELEMEQAAQDYFNNAMVAYVNSQMGFSILYPAVFDEQAVTAGENGLSGRVEGASFRVDCTPNAEGWTTETLLAAQKKETPGAETNMNDITGTGCLTAYGEGETLVRFIIVTPAYVYQAELRYDQELSKDFSLYSDYMMHSFTVDEIGLG